MRHLRARTALAYAAGERGARGAAHDPDILRAAGELVDLTRREADLAIRTVRPAPGDRVIQRLAAYRLAFMAASALLGRRRRFSGVRHQARAGRR